MQIGIIGLGRMGANIARRLARGGHDVLACGRADRERGVPHLLITEVPHEGDRAWCWRAPTGQTLIQIRRRRTGET